MAGAPIHPPISARSPIARRIAQRSVSALGIASLVVVFLIGCQTDPERPAPTPRGWLSEELDDDVRPTLEEVFLEPPIMGTEPLIETLSPDGRFLLVRWNEVHKEGEDEKKLDARLVDLDDPEGSKALGWKIADLR